MIGLMIHLRGAAPLLFCLAGAVALPGCQLAPVEQPRPPVEVQRPPELPEPVETAPTAEEKPVEEPVITPPAPVEVEEPGPPPAPVVCEPPPPTPRAAEPARPKTELPILGALEYVRIDPPGLRLKARIDTGATTSSLDARNLREFERDGKPWVKFLVVDRSSGEATEISRPVVRTTRIKGPETAKRYIVKLKAVIGEIEQYTEFTLYDRSAFNYPVLIGRNFLRDQAIVDVGRRYTVGNPPK
jgi:hypothetical protein